VNGARWPSEWELLGRGLAGIPRQPLRLLRALRRSPPRLAALGRAAAEADVLGWPASGPPSTRFNDRISSHRRFCFGQLPLDTVKAIKRMLGFTVNDVVIALSAGALREWLAAREELPREPLIAMVPVSIRTPEQVGTFGNRVSAMFVPIPTDEPDPRCRLERAHEVMRAAKEIHRATPAELLQDLAEFIPPALSARASRLAFRLVDRRRPLVNCVISNVPGPQVSVYCAGARVEATYPVSVIVDGMGLNITVMSLSGQLNVGIVVDREQVDDPWPLIDELHEALETYARATMEPR
jgi:WS/DGAT/MGAT family acyltransferase